MIKNIKWLLLVSITFMACTSNEEDNSGAVAEVPVTAGTAIFSKYVALGNSLTAGYADGALFIEGQKNSYPKLLSDQFALAGGGTFTIPYMNDNFGGLLFNGNPIPGFNNRLIFNGSSPVYLPGTPTTDIANPLSGYYNNMGVPGAKSFHLITPGYGTFNPYFGRFASSPTTSVLADAVSQSPTFFSLWIGNNDVLSYATSGGTGVNQTGNFNPYTYGSNDITDPNVFASTYNTLLDGTNGLTKNGAKGVVANIPYVASIPFFTTVKYNAATLTIGQATALNSGYAAYNGGLQAAKNAGLITEQERLDRTISFVAGANSLVIVDEYLTNLSSLTLPNYRQTTSADYILISSDGVSAQTYLLAGNGTQFPLADKWVLSKGEVAELKTATDAYNATILSLANSKELAFVDANAALNDVANGGVVFDNFHMTSDYVKGGAFGLDGVHPSARGQAYIANKFIEAINAKYGSTLRKYKAQDFPLSYPAGL
jgi:hypothetical protein